MRVVQGGNGPRLAAEALLTVRIVRETLRQHFDRHEAIEPRIARLVDLSHTTGSEETEQLIGSEPRVSWQRHVESPVREGAILSRSLCQHRGVSALLEPRGTNPGIRARPAVAKILIDLRGLLALRFEGLLQSEQRPAVVRVMRQFGPIDRFGVAELLRLEQRGAQPMAC